MAASTWARVPITSFSSSSSGAARHCSRDGARVGVLHRSPSFSFVSSPEMASPFVRGITRSNPSSNTHERDG